MPRNDIQRGQGFPPVDLLLEPPHIALPLDIIIETDIEKGHVDITQDATAHIGIVKVEREAHAEKLITPSF